MRAWPVARSIFDHQFAREASERSFRAQIYTGLARASQTSKTRMCARLEIRTGRLAVRAKCSASEMQSCWLDKARACFTLRPKYMFHVSAKRGRPGCQASKTAFRSHCARPYGTCVSEATCLLSEFLVIQPVVRSFASLT